MSQYHKSLIDNCSDIRRKGSQVLGRLQCSCGCNSFHLFKRKKTSEEQLEEMNANYRLKNDYWPFGPAIATNKDGISVVRNEFLCFKWKERPLSNYMPSVLSFAYVSAKCEKCGREIVLFDSRLSASLEEKQFIKYGNLGIVEWSKDSSAIEICIDVDKEVQDYSDFNRLRIYRIVNEKKSLFADYEL